MARTAIIEGKCSKKGCVYTLLLKKGDKTIYKSKFVPGATSKDVKRHVDKWIKGGSYIIGRR